MLKMKEMNICMLRYGNFFIFLFFFSNKTHSKTNQNKKHTLLFSFSRHFPSFHQPPTNVSSPVLYSIGRVFLNIQLFPAFFRKEMKKKTLYCCSICVWCGKKTRQKQQPTELALCVKNLLFLHVYCSVCLCVPSYYINSTKILTLPLLFFA